MKDSSASYEVLQKELKNLGKLFLELILLSRHVHRLLSGNKALYY